MSHIYLLDRYRPQAGWFLHRPTGIHGLGHAARVLVWAETVAQSLAGEGTPVDREVVRWAAAVHDVGRLDDGRDRPHGERSAAWATGHLSRIAPDLTPEQVQQVAYLCTWHVPDDTRAPVLCPELICLKDADALDRVRIFDLDPRRLRTARAQALVEPAQALFERSSRLQGDPWEAVRRCALDIGVWS